jgi:hypothetical protein
MSDNQSAVTAAEQPVDFDAFARYLRGFGSPYFTTAAGALAALRRERDALVEAQADMGTALVAAQASNAQKDAALRTVARWATDEKLTAAERINIIAHQPQVRAASARKPRQRSRSNHPDSCRRPSN